MQAVLDANRDKRVTIEDFEQLAVKYLCPHLNLRSSAIPVPVPQP